MPLAGGCWLEVASMEAYLLSDLEPPVLSESLLAGYWLFEFEGRSLESLRRVFDDGGCATLVWSKSRRATFCRLEDWSAEGL